MRIYINVRDLEVLATEFEKARDGDGGVVEDAEPGGAVAMRVVQPAADVER
jgi:hypothetical protein